MADESKQLSESVCRSKKDAKWLQDLRNAVSVKKQKKIDITTGSLKNILGRMPNWKSPGPDIAQGFWLKNSVVCMKR